MLLKGASIATIHPPCVDRADLRVDGDSIVDRGTALRPHRGETVEDCTGLLIMPGQVCAHTHMYSTLSRGMPAPPTPPRNFPEILRKIWWKLDEALDEESIHYSALVGAIEAVQCGTTTIVDHHASPNAIAGSLDIIRDAFAAVGIRGVLCYEVSDRGGSQRRDAGLAENDRFLSATRLDPLVRGLVGAHASFTLSDRSLAALGDLVRYHQSGIHIHVAEAPEDVALTAKRHECGVIERLERHGVLSQCSVLAHGVHLTPRELAQIADAGAWLVHNPRSNMNNGVGHAPVERFGDFAALGTDGWRADMFEEARAAHFGLRDRLGPAAPDLAPRLLDGSQRLAALLFGMPFGTLEPGAVADFVVHQYDPPTPLSRSNVAWHALTGLHPGTVRHVMAAGRWICRDGSVTTVDVPRVQRLAARAAARLWKRMAR
ncbi:MAG: amidohydrolase family protein [Acidobacteria bacterium]|nr:amidohydrolase family protein [Acidobacteriota bacterium]